MTARLVSFAVAAVVASSALAAEPPQSPSEAEARARTWFTDTPLVSHRGERLRFYTDALRGKVVVINFIFTHCPDACPLITRQLVEVADKLGPSLGKDVFFLSISVDPERDTPERLADFARKNAAARPGWTFLTGAPAELELVIAKLGQVVPDPAQHSTGLIAGNDRTQHWKKLRPDVPPAVLADELRRLAAEGAEKR